MLIIEHWYRLFIDFYFLIHVQVGKNHDFFQKNRKHLFNPLTRLNQ